MLYWYRDLLLDEKYEKDIDRHIKKVEQYYHARPKSKIFSKKKRSWENIIGKKIPWKEYFVIVRSVNPENLFEVMGTRQWIFRHYERIDLYVIGLFSSEDNAIKRLEEILCEGYGRDVDFNPRERFADVDKYQIYGG